MHRVVHHARPVRWKRATAGLPEGGTEQLTDALHIFPSTCLRLFSILIRTEGRQFNTAAGLPESSWDVLCAAFHVDNFATILTCAEVCPAPRVSIAAAGCKGCVRCGLKACARHRLLIIARSCCKLSTNIPNLPALSGSHDAPACIGLFTVLAPFAGKAPLSVFPGAAVPKLRAEQHQVGSSGKGLFAARGFVK